MKIDVKLSSGTRFVNPVFSLLHKKKRPLVSGIGNDRGSELRPDNANGFFFSKKKAS
jgi:hypothetical protein